MPLLAVAFLASHALVSGQIAFRCRIGGDLISVRRSGPDLSYQVVAHDRVTLHVTRGYVARTGFRRSSKTEHGLTWCTSARSEPALGGIMHQALQPAWMFCGTVLLFHAEAAGRPGRNLAVRLSLTCQKVISSSIKPVLCAFWQSCGFSFISQVRHDLPLAR